MSQSPLLTVLGHPDYYRRFGFEPSRHYDIEPPSHDIPESVFMVKPLSGYGHGFKGRIVYPSASTSRSWRSTTAPDGAANP